MGKCSKAFLFILFFCAFNLEAQVGNAFQLKSSLDYTQDTISKNLFTATNKIDTYFGKDKPLSEKNGSSIKLEYASTSKEYSLPQFEPDLDIKVRFKQLENKLNFKFSSERTSEDETLENEELPKNQKDGPSVDESVYRASLGFFKEQEKFWSLSFDTGIKVQSSLVPFATTRGRRSFYFSTFELRLVNKVLVEDNGGLFNYTDGDIKKKLSRDFNFTYSNKFVWKDSDSEFTTSHGPTISQSIDDLQGISYNLRTRFFNRPLYGITGHEVYSTYRRNLYKDWIVLKLTPGISFFSISDFRREAFFKLKLQAFFGDF